METKKPIRMRYRLFILSIITFFLIINTSYYWERMIGIALFPIILILGVCFLVLLALFFFQLSKAWKEHFKNKTRVFTLVILFIVLVSIVLFPNGIINYDKLEGKNLLIAYAEGVAGCGTTLKLKANNKYKITSVCFGIREMAGEYNIKGDTIYFKTANRQNKLKPYRFAIIEKIDSIKPIGFENAKGITLYETNDDDFGYPMIVLNKK